MTSSHRGSSPGLKRVILVVGGAGGIGSAVADRLVREQASVVVSSRVRERAEQAARDLGAEPAQLDPSLPSEIEHCLAGIVERHGRLDGLVNCAGSMLLKPAHLTTDAEWSETLAANLTSSFNLLRAAVPHLMREGGAVVLCSSVAARRGLFNHEAIAAAKAGVEGLALAAASTYARYRIRINCVAPGLVRTPLSRSITESPAAMKVSLGLHALGRVGEPADVASAICWLLAPEQSWVTGQVIGVDGGLGSVQAR